MYETGDDTAEEDKLVAEYEKKYTKSLLPLL